MNESEDENDRGDDTNGDTQSAAKMTCPRFPNLPMKNLKTHDTNGHKGTERDMAFAGAPKAANGATDWLRIYAASAEAV